MLRQKLVYTGSPHQVGVCLCASFCIQLFCVVLYAPFFSVFNSSLVVYLTALTVAARRFCHSSVTIWLTTGKPGTQPTHHGHTAAAVVASYVTPTHPYNHSLRIETYLQVCRLFFVEFSDSGFSLSQTFLPQPIISFTSSFTPFTQTFPKGTPASGVSVSKVQQVVASTPHVIQVPAHTLR